MPWYMKADMSKTIQQNLINTAPLGFPNNRRVHRRGLNIEQRIIPLVVVAYPIDSHAVEVSTKQHLVNKLNRIIIFFLPMIIRTSNWKHASFPDRQMKCRLWELRHNKTIDSSILVTFSAWSIESPRSKNQDVFSQLCWPTVQHLEQMLSGART